jgi:hypothetical protein
MILMVTNERDEHSNVVASELGRKGASYIRFDTEMFPLRAGLTIRFGDLQEDLSLFMGDQRVDLNSIRTVWFRRPEKPSGMEMQSLQNSRLNRRRY